MKTEKLTEARFLNDVAKHQMVIKLDHGVHRHVVFRNPDCSNMWFELVTYPGRLVYSGDMGCFVFNRLHDMFTFFRGRVNPSKPDALYINEGYWHEKLEAVDRHDGSEGYSFAKFKEACEEQIASFLKDESEDIELLNSLKPNAEPFEAELREAAENEVYSYAEECQADAYRVANDFTFSSEAPYDNGLSGLSRWPFTLKVEFSFSDIWECNSNEYSLRFLWCCYALNWGIRVYDAHHAGVRLHNFAFPEFSIEKFRLAVNETVDKFLHDNAKSIAEYDSYHGIEDYFEDNLRAEIGDLLKTAETSTPEDATRMAGHFRFRREWTDAELISIIEFTLNNIRGMCFSK